MVSNSNARKGANVNKLEFVTEISKRCDVSAYLIEEILLTMSKLAAERLMKGEGVEIPKLGTFHLVKRKERVGKNLFGEAEKQLEECYYPTFKIWKPFKTRIKHMCRQKNNAKSYDTEI